MQTPLTTRFLNTLNPGITASVFIQVWTTELRRLFILNVKNVQLKQAVFVSTWLTQIHFSLYGKLSIAQRSFVRCDSLCFSASGLPPLCKRVIIDSQLLGGLFHSSLIWQQQRLFLKFFAVFGRCFPLYKFDSWKNLQILKLPNSSTFARCQPEKAHTINDVCNANSLCFSAALF